jgi:hypothetical protein
MVHLRRHPLAKAWKKGRIRIPLGEPIHTTPLSPIFRLHLGQVGELALQVVAKGPTLVIQASGVCAAIKDLNPS